jgi:hypothetical protein
VTEPGARGGYFAKIVLNVSSISFLPRTRPVGAAADGGKNIVRVLGEKWHESREVAVAKRRQELGHDALDGLRRLVLRVNGTSRNRWRSLASSDIRPTDKAETREKKVTKATEKMFKNYPPQSR